MDSLRAGVGLTEEDDRLLALGFPHVMLPVDKGRLGQAPIRRRGDEAVGRAARSEARGARLARETQLSASPSPPADAFAPFWIRPTYLAGERGVALEAARWRAYPPAEHAGMAASMVEIASPAVATMLAEMGL